MWVVTDDKGDILGDLFLLCILCFPSMVYGFLRAITQGVLYWMIKHHLMFNMTERLFFTIVNLSPYVYIAMFLIWAVPRFFRMKEEKREAEITALAEN